MKAIARSIRITSKKLNLIAGMVRTKDVTTAMNVLKFTPKKGANILRKIVQSAVANAENNFKQDAQNLFVKEIIVTEGASLKRSVPISRGRVHPIKKRTAHATVILGVRENAEMKSPKATEGTKATKTTKKAKEVSAETKEAPAKKPRAKKATK